MGDFLAAFADRSANQSWLFLCFLRAIHKCYLLWMQGDFGPSHFPLRSHQATCAFFLSRQTQPLSCTHRTRNGCPTQGTGAAARTQTEYAAMEATRAALKEPHVTAQVRALPRQWNTAQLALFESSGLLLEVCC
jgi:hypothetical protein